MDENIDFIGNILKRYLDPDKHKAFLFGSRVTGSHEKFSDFDIAIDGAELSPECYFEIVSAFEESNFPYKVDIVQKKDLSEGFLRTASKNIVIIPITDGK